MVNILVLNIGSSSVKYDLFNDGSLLLKGNIERIRNYESALKTIMSEIISKGFVVDAIGHRVVHGGSHSQSVLVDSAKLKELKSLKNLAPLHNPAEIAGIQFCMKLFSVPNVAVFDTAFHQSMPKKAYTYAIPKYIAEKYKIRRYGFHGSSHKYVSEKAALLMGKSISKTRIITCHLGNGCSVAAIKSGISIDTSMGFTPLEGLVMGTRCGDIDPEIVAFIQEKENLSSAKIKDLLNNRSGLLALCGMTDMRDIHKAAESDSSAALAQDVFCYRISKYIGAYIAVLGGVDAIVFTGGIGEHAWWLRETILENFSHMGIRINKRANEKNSIKFSSFMSRVYLFAIPTNEELVIAQEVKHLLYSKKSADFKNN